MQRSVKIRYSVFIGIFMAFAALALFFCLPQSAYAATGTLGTETPYFYCTYADAEGNEVDGNKLDAGTYTVTFNVQDMASASVMQITASYPETVTLDDSTVTQISDTDTNFSSMGYLASDGNIVFGYVSNEADTSSLNTEGTALFSVDMTFPQECDTDGDGYIDPDTDGLISISSDPNLSFALADYGDGYDDEYALVDVYDGYPGALYIMTADVSPSGGYDISGQIKVATDLTGTETTGGIVGINVSVQKDGATIAQSVTDENGNYTLSAIPAGEYTMLISGDTTIDREVTLIVTESKTVDSVGIVICDYNQDIYINSIDLSAFIVALSEYNVYADLNCDSYVNSVDLSSFVQFLNNEVVYADVTL